jgi:hypothetical protein
MPLLPPTSAAGCKKTWLLVSWPSHSGMPKKAPMSAQAPGRTSRPAGFSLIFSSVIAPAPYGRRFLNSSAAL